MQSYEDVYVEKKAYGSQLELSVTEYGKNSWKRVVEQFRSVICGK
jgi:hypothetical protein